MLPPSPADGQSASFTGSSLQQSPDPSTLSGQFGLLIGQVNRLVYQQHLGDKVGQDLLGQLGKAGTSLQSARPDQAEHELQKFRNDLTTLDKKKLIDPAVAASLAKGALGIETFLSDRANVRIPPPPDPTLYCSGNGAPCPDTLKSCEFTSWFVNGASNDPTPNGSPIHPFPSITEALAEAAKANLCGVTLHVAPACYSGPIEITRHTRIIGQRELISTTTFPSTIIDGSVSNHGPYLLEMRYLTLSWFHDEVANGVFVDHPCATTLLQNVAVLGYRGFGIRQRGGSLLSRRTIVSNTRAHPDSLFQGTGMLLSCGVQAELVFLVLDSNESAGLMMVHPGTMVDAFHLIVRGTRVHPSLLAGTSGDLSNYAGAVQVRHQAQLNATSVLISENWLAGVLVDTGAVALLDYGTVDHTAIVDLPGSLVSQGGVNAAAIRDGHLMMSNVISTRAALCGVLVASDGELDLSGRWIVTGPGRHDFIAFSQVTRSAIGACVDVPGYRLSRLNSSTIYVDNDRDIEGAGSDIPVPPGPPPELEEL